MPEDNSNVASSTETEQVETTTQKNEEVEEKTPKGKTYSRSELNKIVSAEIEKVRNELKNEYENKKSEAEKLAKMDAEQKLNYQLEQKSKEVESLTSEINSLKLSTQAQTYATEKGLPLGYIEDLDYSKETADSIKERVDKLVKLRSDDLKGYLNDKLKQPNPKAVNESLKLEDDPYIKGFKSYK